MRALVVISLVSSFALAEEGTPDTASDPSLAVVEDFGHRGQLGVNARIGAGYRMIAPYGEEYCGQVGKSVCAARSPMYMEVGVSYGITRAFGLVADIRLGLVDDFSPTSDKPRTLAISPGIKLFPDDEGRVKFFSTIQASIDLTDFSASGAEAATDYGLRNINGIELDIERHLGMYVHFGETIGFTRWLRFEMDGGVGIEGRFP